MKFQLVLFICSMLTSSLWSQHNNTSKQELAALGFLPGMWNVEVDARLSMNGPWEKSAGTSMIKLTLDSTLIEEEFTGTREGKPFLSKTLFAFNNATGKYQRLFIDAPHGVLIDFEGTRDQGQLIFEKLWAYANGNSVRLRVIYTINSDKNFTLESQRMPQGSTTWDTTGRMKYSKR